MSKEEKINHVETLDCLFKWRRTLSPNSGMLEWDDQDEEVFLSLIKIVMKNLIAHSTVKEK